MSGGSTAGTSSDTSTGAKEQSTGSAAAGDISKSTDKASCDKAGGVWDDTGESCAEKKM